MGSGPAPKILFNLQSILIILCGNQRATPPDTHKTPQTENFLQTNLWNSFLPPAYLKFSKEILLKQPIPD